MTHILVIDNNIFGRMQLADMLLAAHSELTVTTVVHGYMSINSCGEHHPDLVIAEIQNQELEAFESILSLREFDPALPVLLTSRGTPVVLKSRGLPFAVVDTNATTSSATHTCSLLSAVRTCLSTRHTAIQHDSAVN